MARPSATGSARSSSTPNVTREQGRVAPLSLFGSDTEGYVEGTARLGAPKGTGRAPFQVADVWGERTQLLEKVTEEWGPIVPREELPTLVGALEEGFDRLSRAQEETLGSFGDTELFIVDSDVVNAFTTPVREPGAEAKRTMVFLTTGYLEHSLRKVTLAAHPPSPERLASLVTLGLTQTLSVSAHELAHGQTDEHGQEEELRADLNGTMLLRDAGLPADGLLLGLRDLENPSRPLHPAASIADAGTSSHPSFALRLAGVRSLLTFQRYELGKQSVSFEPLDPAAAARVVRELEGVKERRAAGPRFVMPGSLPEAVERLGAAFGKYRLYGDEAENRAAVQEAELLLRSLQPLLPRTEEELARVDLTPLLTLFAQVSKWQPVLAPTLSLGRPLDGITRNGNAWQQVEGLRGTKPHLRALQEHPFFRLPSFLERVEQELLPALGFERAGPEAGEEPDFALAGKQLSAQSMFLPADVVFERHRDALVPLLENRPATSGLGGWIPEAAVELRLRVGNLYFQEVFPRLAPAEKRRAFETHAFALYDPLFNASGPSDTPPGAELRALQMRDALTEGRAAGEGRPPSEHAELELHRTLLGELWAQRAFPALTELDCGQPLLPWRYIAQVLELAPRQWREQLRAGIRDWFKQPDRRLGSGAYSSSVKAFLAECREPSARVSRTVPLTWAAPSLAPCLDGRVLAPSRHHPAPALERLRRQLGGMFPGLFEAQVRDLLQGALSEASPPCTFEELQTRLAEGLGDLEVHASFVGDAVWAEAISSSPLPEDVKRTLLEQVYMEKRVPLVDSLAFGRRPFDWDTREGAAPIARLLLRHGVVSRASDLVPAPPSPATPGAGERGGDEADQAWNHLHQVVAELEPLLVEELDAAVAKGPDALRETVHRMVAWIDVTAAEDYGAPRLRGFRMRLANAVRCLEWAPPEAEALFHALRRMGPLTETDLLYVEQVLPARKDAPESILEVLESGALRSPKIRLDVVRYLFEPKLEALEALKGDRLALTREASTVVAVVDKFLHGGGMAKDEYLEEIAWRLELDGELLRGLIEDRKSYNWRRLDPRVVDLTSGLASYVYELPRSEREELLRYLLEPDPVELPGGVRRSLEKVSKYGNPEYAQRAQTLLEDLVFDSTPMERTPLIEMSLSTGPGALSRDRNFFEHMSREYLGYAEGSVEEKLLLSFLRVIPEHEQTVTLSYLLGQSAEPGEGSVKRLFAVFQSVGIKFGQLAAIWNLFGDAVSEQIRDLCDNAPHMTRQEILDVMASSLTASDRERVKPVRILGSASMKTVVEVLLDGKPAVMMIQRPHAAARIESNLELGRALLVEARAAGVELPVTMLENLLEALEEQLQEELKMTVEATRIDDAARSLEELNGKLAKGANGWRFAVPKVRTEIPPQDHLMFVDLGVGVGFDELPPGDAQDVGPFVVQSMLELLFRHGRFDPDRHPGNWKFWGFDAKQKVVAAFDFGQWEHYQRGRPWQWDDALTISRFVQAVDGQNPAQLVDAALRMAKPESAEKVERATLERAVEPLLHSDAPDVGDQMTRLITALCEAGLKFEKRFMFGALKGLLVLFKTGYVEPETFEALLRDQVKHTLVRKLPALALDKLAAR